MLGSKILQKQIAASKTFYEKCSPERLKAELEKELGYDVHAAAMLGEFIYSVKPEDTKRAADLVSKFINKQTRIAV